MDTWERFSRALEEAKRVEEECGCEESDTKPKKKTPSLNAIKTDINNAKNKLRSMGLKMSQELEGEQLDEFLGTGTVLAPKTDVTGTQMYRQNKFLGMNVGSPYQNSDWKPKASEVQRYNSQPNRPSTIQKTSDIGTSITGYTSQVAKPKPTPAPTAPKPAAQQTQQSQYGNVGSLGNVGGNLKFHLDRTKQYNSTLQGAIKNLNQSYQPEGEVVEGLLDTLDKTARSAAGTIGGRIGRNQASKMPGGNFPIIGDIIKNQGEKQGTQQGQQTYDDVKNKLRSMGLKMSQELEGELVDEGWPFGPDTTKPKNSPTGTKSVEVGKKYPALQNGQMSNVTYDKQGNKTVKPMTGIERGVAALSLRNAGGSSMSPMMNQYQSYELDGELVDESKKDLPQTKMYRKAGNLARQALSSKGAKKEKAMDRSAKIVSAITRETERKRFDEIGKSPAHNEEFELTERVRPGNVETPLDKAAFKKRRRSLAGKEKSADAKERGHVSKDIVTHGRTYSPDEAKSNRSNMSDYERSSRHRSSVDPDDDRDENMYSSDKTKNPKKLRKQKAMGEISKEGFELDERHMTSSEMKKETSLKKKYDPSSMKEKMIQQYGPEKGKNVYFATIRKKAMSEGKLDDLLKDIRGEDENPKSSKPSKPGRGMSAKTAAERAAAIRTAGKTKSKQIEAKARLATEKEKTARQQAAFKRSDERKRQKELEQKDKEKRSSIQSAGDAAEKAYKEKTAARREGRNKFISDIRTSGVTATSKQNDLQALSAMGSNVGSLVKSVAGHAIGSAIQRHQTKKDERNIAKLRQKAETQAAQSQPKPKMEGYSNWREELIIEVDDASVTNNQPEKIIDVSKKKNKIEINPKLSEQRQHLREFLPALMSAIRLGGAEALGAAAGETAAAGEASTLGSKAKDLLKNKIKDTSTGNGQNKSASTATSSQSDLGALSSMTAKEGFSDWRSELAEGDTWHHVKYQNPKGGLTSAGVKKYREEHPGSHLQTAVRTKPSKLKPGSKSANRRKSFCARMSGMKKKLTSAKTANDPDSRINKSLRAWNC